MEDQWELWDVLNLLYAGGYDVTRLWKADPDDADAFCAVIPPEPFRLYSIASAPPPGHPASTLQLVVAGLEYTSARTRGPTRGSARARRRISCAGRASRPAPAVAADRRPRPGSGCRPIRRAPSSCSRPAPGIAPFLGFVAARTGPGENLLYLGIRTPEEYVAHPASTRPRRRAG